MAGHVGRQASGNLFQHIGKGNIVKMVDPGGGIDPGTGLDGGKGLDILAVKVKMPQHFPAVAGDKHTVPDKKSQFLKALVQRERTQIQIDVNHNIFPVLQRAGGRDGIFHIGADRFESPVFPVGGTGPDQGALIGVGGEPAFSVSWRLIST